MTRWLLLPALGLLGVCALGDEIDASKLPPPAAAQIDFARDVRPLLESRCVKCHGGAKPKGKFSLETLRTDAERRRQRAGPGQRRKCQKQADSSHCRTDRRLADAAQGRGHAAVGGRSASCAWIDQGVKWPAGIVLKAAATDDKRNHWAFKAPVRPALPAVKESNWPRTAIDHFILARLEREGLKPSPEADQVTLLRRLYLDLIGLPPTPKEVDEYLADQNPRAYDAVVEKLLASPHYGERWGRHWLDAARYADSDGFEKDMSRQVWFYRDWVVNAFNRDLPYDRFVIEQLAGDLLPNATQEQIVATGFFAQFHAERGGRHRPGAIPHG